MTPYRVWKTLNMHGPSTAREIAARWASVPVEDVKAGAIPPVEIALAILAEHRLVSWQQRYTGRSYLWEALPLPDDDDERKALLKYLAAEWRRRKRTIDVSPDR